MIKIWPIHKHVYKAFTFVDNNSRNVSDYPYEGVMLACYCKKIKGHKFKGGAYRKDEAAKYIRAKGWQDDTQVQNFI